MRKSLLTVCLLSAVSLTVYAQNREKYEFKRNLPVYAEQLIADLDYPLSWENSGIKNFNKWRKNKYESYIKSG